jgi:hypothetical protein
MEKHVITNPNNQENNKLKNQPRCRPDKTPFGNPANNKHITTCRRKKREGGSCEDNLEDRPLIQNKKSSKQI